MWERNKCRGWLGGWVSDRQMWGDWCAFGEASGEPLGRKEEWRCSVEVGRGGEGGYWLGCCFLAEWVDKVGGVERCGGGACLVGGFLWAQWISGKAMDGKVEAAT